MNKLSIVHPSQEIPLEKRLEMIESGKLVAKALMEKLCAENGFDKFTTIK
jgi:hypothetical protein